LSEPTLNLGILAHVDAGKTTLTERLLYEAGVIGAVGSVDRGTTQTDTLALERQRGITIRSAVVSFAVGGTTVNLIDTPGHPDFIAEVERVLGVLDGAVLVLSAVEGVQPQTRILHRALRRLGVPTLLFVNKIDRAGADAEGTLAAIEERLTSTAVAMGAVAGASFVPFGPADRELVRRSRAGALHPVFFGSALTGAGVDELAAGIAELLPAAAGDAGGPLCARVFKLDPDRTAYVRMFSGSVHVRDRLEAGKVTALRVVADGGPQQRERAGAGEIALLRGLDVRIGDWIGERRPGAEHRFAPPTLESVVVPAPGDANRLHVALGRFAEQDPLIDVRQDDARHELSVSLYGEVQKEVLQATLALDYGLAVGFRETTTICVERPVGAGRAVEILNADSNPFPASVGLRVEPAPLDSGVELRLEVSPQSMPLYFAKTAEGFASLMRASVEAALREGLHGWQVTDCVVTMTDCAYPSADGPPSTRGPLSTPGDFRNLTPLVLMDALRQAGTRVCEPVLRVRLDVPTGAIGAVLAALARLGAHAELRGAGSRIETVLPADRLRDLQRQLPGLTAGEGVLESDFAGYRPVAGDPPERARIRPNPLDRDEYLHALRRGRG
jgi:ribosomal protection tetracycline resistance protein